MWNEKQRLKRLIFIKREKKSFQREREREREIFTTDGETETRRKL